MDYFWKRMFFSVLQGIITSAIFSIAFLRGFTTQQNLGSAFVSAFVLIINIVYQVLELRGYRMGVAGKKKYFITNYTLFATLAIISIVALYFAPEEYYTYAFSGLEFFWYAGITNKIGSVVLVNLIMLAEVYLVQLTVKKQRKRRY